ncbi:hypothetical protein AVEN_20381-1 [Araneus ventricosus]|uniref:Uncharacterized protein n=1 Tax=Araneus ventricosus TaxID=182803 RepID=A0A4Y2FSW8_ARAVE|nr:hypothetical protein AVEN_20381-1 [Araneus ventricosus]
MLGNSKMIASKRLDQLWTHLERDPTMKALYLKFLNEYESLHHMEVKEDTDLDAGIISSSRHLRPDNKRLSYESYSTLSLKTSSGSYPWMIYCQGSVLQEDLFDSD